MNKFLVLKDDEKINVQAADVEAAATEGVSLTTYLNNKYSNIVEKFNGELDAFDIALLSKGIIVKDNLEFGIQSSSMMKFFTTDENRNLFPEFIIRQLRQISGMPSIINDLVASTRVINGDSAKQIVLDLSNTPAGQKNKQALSKRRIAEGANIPVATLKLGEVSIKIYKYGVGVKATYEVLRRTTIDMFRKQMELVSLQAGYDEVGAVIEVVEQGDGNTNPAEVYKASELNPDAKEGKFLVKQAPFNYDTLLVDEEVYTQICTILMDKNLTNAINPKVNFEFPQGLLNNLKVIYSEDLGLTSDGKHQIIGLAKNYAIEKTIEAGSTINEVSKTVENQTQLAVMTENAGFNKIDSRASAILVLA
jgi:hypothetical protein